MTTTNLALTALALWATIALVFKILGVAYFNARGAMFTAAAVTGLIGLAAALGYVAFQIIGAAS